MIDDNETGNIAQDQPGPELSEVDNSDRGRFTPIPPKDAWVPGLIEVVFKEATQSGVRGWDFAEEQERSKFSEAWPNELTTFLQLNGLISWKPSFPLRYPWTKQSNEDARKNYEAAGRDKFVTFNFPKEADTRRVADELRALLEIEQAVAVPRIGPPSGPLAEPFMGTTDQPIATTRGFKSQWYIFRCKVNQAWTKSRASGKGVTIADIDWGFNRNHQDLAKQIKKTQHVLPNIPNPTAVDHGNRCAHGTAVLGLAGAEVNGSGIAGIAFEADLWAIQAGTEDIEDHSLWVAGISFIVDEKSEGRKIIILEIETKIGGNIEMIPTIAEEIRQAINHHNIVVCVPAGNGSGDAGIGDDGKPISFTGSILVGATRFDPKQPLANIRGISKDGRRVVVYAPGDADEDLTCGDPRQQHLNDRYRSGFGGTSSAVAKVAGAVALMLEKNPQLTNGQVSEILRQSQTLVVDDSGNQLGVLLDAEHAAFEALKRASDSSSDEVNGALITSNA